METIKIAANSGSANDHGSPSQEGEAKSESKAHLEHIDAINEDLVYDDAEHEPQLHFRTWVALAAMWLYNYVIVLTLLSPPVVVCSLLVKAAVTVVLTSVSDLIHRSESQRREQADVGAQFAHPSSSGPCASLLLGVGCLSGPQIAYGRPDRPFFYWCRHCSWLANHI